MWTVNSPQVAEIILYCRNEGLFMKSVYGEVVAGLVANGKPVTEGLFNEHAVRAAAGITLVLGAVAFVYAYFGKQYLPIKLVTMLFFIEFSIRTMFGIRYSPVGLLARALTWNRQPLWVSARPKRFAWTLGLALSLAMTIITNSNIRGPLPLTICLFCLSLMWMEAVLGFCLGCEIYRCLTKRGWFAKDAPNEICSNGTCRLENLAVRIQSRPFDRAAE
jgi:hypothetical protein